jgi:hypothetical protein
MSRARNAVIIIILCIIGAYSVKKGPQLGLNMPAPEEIRDAVAGNRIRRNAPKLTLASGTGEDLRDAVAGHAVGTPGGTNTLGDVDGPPRGNGNGGFGPLSANNNNNNPPPPPLSPSSPDDEVKEKPCGDYGPQSRNECYVD